MGLPAAYRVERIHEGIRHPDYGALDAAIPGDLFEDHDPQVVDMRTLGDRLLAVSEALPKIGKQGTFPYLYGSLTHSFADKLDGKSAVSHLPVIENEEVLIRQANRFVWSYLRPVARYCRQERGSDAPVEPRLRLSTARDRHWMFSFDSTDVQFGEPPVQFVGGGMAGHILTDLGIDLVRSKVTAAYMRRGGDYDNTNKFIKYITLTKADELIPGRSAAVKLVAHPVYLAIGGMRRVARSTYNELRYAKSQEEFDSIQAGAVADGVRVSRLTAQYGNTAIRLFAVAAGAKTLADKRQQLSAERDAV